MDKICHTCNRPNPSDAAFCRHCASPLSPGQSGEQKRENAPPFQQQQPNYVEQPRQNIQVASAGPSQKAIASVALAGVGLICCGPFTGIPAAIVGWMEITAIKEGRSSPSGMWMAQVGLWGGIAVSIIHTILSFLWILLSMASGPAYY